MATQYNGIAENQEAVQIPEDSDVADSESVDVALRNIWNSIRLSLQTAGARPTHQLVQMRSVDQVSVVFSHIPQFIQNIRQAFPYQYLAYLKNTVTMTVSDLDTGLGTFKADTAYYCYIRWKPDLAKFISVISEDFPEETLCNEKADPELTRYLGAFFTDAAKRIKLIHKSGAFYTYDSPDVALNQTTDVTGSADLTGKIPNYCKKVRLFIEIVSNTVNNQLFISADGGPERSFVVGSTTGYSHFPVDLPLLNTKIIKARFGVATGSVGLLRLEGMYET